MNAWTTWGSLQGPAKRSVWWPWLDTQDPGKHEQHQSRTDKTKDVLLDAKDRRIKALEEENRKLKEGLKVAYGKWNEQV